MIRSAGSSSASAAGLAQSATQLIAARAGMGVGGGLLMTTTLAVVVRIFDDVERVKAIGLAAAGDAGERERISDAFASGLQTSQLVGAVAVPAGGLLAAMLLRRVDRAESPRAAE